MKDTLPQDLTIYVTIGPSDCLLSRQLHGQRQIPGGLPEQEWGSDRTPHHLFGGAACQAAKPTGATPSLMLLAARANVFTAIAFCHGQVALPAGAGKG